MDLQAIVGSMLVFFGVWLGVCMLLVMGWLLLSGAVKWLVHKNPEDVLFDLSGIVIIIVSFYVMWLVMPDHIKRQVMP